MFQVKYDNLTSRFFAYWIFTYGVIRISNYSDLVSYSYYIEAACITNEYNLGTISKNKALFVIILSLLLGYFVE
jgi:hypothetical protein